MGVIIGGIPAIVIGFNKDVAWSHTVTKAIHFPTFRLALDPADSNATTYLIDGNPIKITSKTVSVDLLQADGTLAGRSKTFWFRQQGAVIVKPEAGMTWAASAAYALADPNRNNTRMLEQWLGIARANSVQAIKTSLDKTIGLPWANTLAADRDGKILFADASVVTHAGAQSYIQTVGFDDQGPVAQGVLIYGQSTDPMSSHYADQTGVYSRKEWPVLPFAEDKIEAAQNYTTITLRSD